MTLPSKSLFFGFLYLTLLSCYAVFSYSLTAPNLVLSSWTPFWRFQLLMWETFFNNRVLLTQAYFSLITALVCSYGFFIYSLRKTKLSIWQQLCIILFACAPLLLSNNALSYDVFNYIFNARMIVEYQVNPHSVVAQRFSDDPWLRFMHNVHTPAPYGYGWTALSLVPYLLGSNVFIITWLLFRLMSLISLVATFLSVNWAIRQWKFKISEVIILSIFLNPLLLIEVISTMHNDLWMIFPAVLSFALLSPRTKNHSLAMPFLSLGALLFSVSIKYATVALLPLWALGVVCYLNHRWRASAQLDWWPLLASLALFLPLLTARSQYFHPWYLTWSLIFAALIPQVIKTKTQLLFNRWRLLLMIASISSLYRYLPYFYENKFSQFTLFNQQLITFVPIVIFTLWASFDTVYKHYKSK